MLLEGEDVARVACMDGVDYLIRDPRSARSIRHSACRSNTFDRAGVRVTAPALPLHLFTERLRRGVLRLFIYGSA
jgi:hypothetical protein